MCCVGRSMRPRRAVLLGCALACLWTFPAFADETSPVQTSSALEVSGDIRLTAIDGEKSWLEGGFGKLRSGADNDVRLQPQLGNASLVWKPQLSWSVGAVIVGMMEGGQRTQAGLSQGYLSFRPMRSQEFALSARAGLMWLPVSLEHEGSDWHVKNSITPSAINSWVGEELKPLAAEGTLATRIGENDIRATAAVTAANDTAGTLLTFRGWALHDWTTLALNRQPLPPVGVFAGVQARYTHPLLDIHEGFAKHLGYYAKLAWSPPVPIRIELLRYDNGANPQDVTSSGPEWGWRTRFDHIGMVADLGSGTEFKSQVLQGTTRMGFPAGGRRWVDERFRSA